MKKEIGSDRPVQGGAQTLKALHLEALLVRKRCDALERLLAVNASKKSSSSRYSCTDVSHLEESDVVRSNAVSGEATSATLPFAVTHDLFGTCVRDTSVSKPVLLVWGQAFPSPNSHAVFLGHTMSEHPGKRADLPTMMRLMLH